MSKYLVVVKYHEANRYSLAYLASILEHYAASRRCFEVVFTRDVADYVSKVYTEFDRVFVMYSLMTPQIFELVDEFRKLKELKTRAKNVILIAGGPHAAGDPRGTITRLGFDIAVLREGELTVPKLLDTLVSGSWADLQRVPNIVFRSEDGSLVETEFKLLAELHGSAPMSDRFDIYAPIEIMRGCCFACKYCQTPRIYRFRVRYRPLDQIATWCRHYARKGIKVIKFLAPNGFGYGSPDGKTPAPDKLERLLKTAYDACEGKAKLTLGVFPSEVRPDFVKREVLEVVSKYVDNKKLAIGVQTGSDRLLKLIGRGHDVHCVYEAVDLAIEYGFIPYVDFIFGLPGETEEDVEETVKLMLYLARKGCFIRGHTFMPLPGTPFEKAPPGRVHPRYLDAIREIMSMGRIDGYWREQEEIAEKIHRYLTSDEPLV